MFSDVFRKYNKKTLGRNGLSYNKGANMHIQEPIYMQNAFFYKAFLVIYCPKTDSLLSIHHKMFCL